MAMKNLIVAENISPEHTESPNGNEISKGGDDGGGAEHSTEADEVSPCVCSTAGAAATMRTPPSLSSITASPHFWSTSTSTWDLVALCSHQELQLARAIGKLLTQAVLAAFAIFINIARASS